MKLLLCATVLAIMHMMIGCVSLKYQGVEYYRMGDQHIKNLSVYHVLPDGSCIKVILESQDSEATALTNAINTLGGLAK